MRWLMLLVAFVVGGGTTWLLTVRSVTRTLPVGREPEPDAARFGGPPTTSSVDTHGAGARWMAGAEDEDALLHPHRAPDDSDPGRA